MGNFCDNCGAELKEGAHFCPECGHMTNTKTTSTAAPRFSNLKIGAILAIVGIVLIAGAFIALGSTTTDYDDTYYVDSDYSDSSDDSSWFGSSGDMESHDFSGISMLVPEGSTYTYNETYSERGVNDYYLNDDYSSELYSIEVVKKSKYVKPSDVEYDHSDGDIDVYTGTESEDVLFMTRGFDDFVVITVGTNEDMMKEMLDSVELYDYDSLF